MAKMEAQAAGADDAWMLDQDGLITEGSSNNAYILTHDDVIITRQLGHEILSGITRKAILALAQQDTLTVEERPFSVEEALQAKEAFISSASSFVWPVTHINDQPIGAGTPGPVAKKLRLMYIETALASADD
jgi:D-alanine transaminase